MPVPNSKPEITAEVGGQKNVEALLKVSRDFRSEQQLYLQGSVSAPPFAATSYRIASHRTPLIAQATP